MSTNIHSTDQMAARSLRTYALTMIVGPLLALVMVINSGINVLWPWYAVTGISMISLISIIKFPNMGQAKSSAFFIAIFVFACLASSVNSHIIAETKMPQTIFGAYKVGAMFIALIAPAPAWLGYALISFCIVIPPLQALTVSPEVLNLATQSEPWYTIIYTTASLLILKYRLESQNVQTRLLETKANEKALRDFVNISSELRDLAAAPLEEQDRLADLLSEEKISQKMAAEKIRESTKKLNELVYILNTHHKGLLVKMSRNSKAPTESTSLNLSKNKKISQQLG